VGRSRITFVIERLVEIKGKTKSEPKANRKFKIKTPTLPKTGEEWGTQEAWRREAKPKFKT
jgi:hypothetical protein